MLACSSGKPALARIKSGPTRGGGSVSLVIARSRRRPGRATQQSMTQASAKRPSWSMDRHATLAMTRQGLQPSLRGAKRRGNPGRYRGKPDPLGNPNLSEKADIPLTTLIADVRLLSNGSLIAVICSVAKFRPEPNAERFKWQRTDARAHSIPRTGLRRPS